MPRYYFHVEDGKDFPDLQGTVLPDIEAAQNEAVRFMGDLLAHSTDSFWTGREWTMRVTDANDVELFDLNFVASMKPGALSGDAVRVISASISKADVKDFPVD